VVVFLDLKSYFRILNTGVEVFLGRTGLNVLTNSYQSIYGTEILRTTFTRIEIIVITLLASKTRVQHTLNYMYKAKGSGGLPEVLKSCNQII